MIDLLKERGADDIPVFGGGLIHPDDFPFLTEIGVKAIFTPGATADSIRKNVERVLLDRISATGKHNHA